MSDGRSEGVSEPSLIVKLHRCHMTEPLTIDQITDLVRYLDNQADQMCGSDGVAAHDILKSHELLRAERDAAYRARDNFQTGIESMRQERTTLQREYARVCEKRDEFQAQLATMVGYVADVIHERDALKAHLNDVYTALSVSPLSSRPLSCYVNDLLAEAQEQWTKTNAQYESAARAVTRLTIQLAAAQQNIDREAFAKQQRAEVWREAAKAYADEIIYHVRFDDYCEAQARELDA